MDRKTINAADAVQTPGTYAQAMLLTGAKEILLISGQIGINVAGVAAAGFEAQAKLAWSNIDAQLRAAGMTKTDLVKITIYLADRKYSADYRQARDTYLAGHQVALTTVICDIFDENWLLEIEAIAAR